MKKRILIGILLCVVALSGCMQAEIETPPARDEAAMKTEAGREAYIAEELYEGAKILSEFKNEETGFIVTEFSAGDLHSFIFFRPTEKGYAYNGEAHETLDDMVTEALAPMGDGDYHVFLRHSDDIVSVDVTYFDAETYEMLQNGTITFVDGNLALMLQNEEINHWRTHIVAYDKDGQKYILLDGEPPTPEEIESMERMEKERERRRFARKVISFAVIFVAANVIAEIRRKK